MTKTSGNGRARCLASNILIYMLGVILVASAAAKFAQVPQIASQLAALGFDGGKLTLVAVLELGSTVLFMVLRTRAVGLLLVSAYLGGAGPRMSRKTRLALDARISRSSEW